MNDYQSLLDQAVARMNAERGFVVLTNSDTYAPTQCVATHNFDPVPLFQYVEGVSKEYAMIRHGLPLINQEQLPILTNNINPRYFCLDKNSPMKYGISDPPLRSLLIVPLRYTSGLLWCDRHWQSGLFQQQDMKKIVAFIAQNEKPPTP
jgi:hypothetical protein